MKTKKIIAIMMALTLALGVVGCGKDEASDSTPTTQEDSSYEDSLDSVELNEENIYALGARQTEEIKDIVEKYGAKVGYGGKSNIPGVDMMFSKGEEGLIEGQKGYKATSLEWITPKEEKSNKYQIEFKSARIEEFDALNYWFEISIKYPAAQEFKLDDFKMFKELLQVVHGKNYDTTLLEKRIKEQIRKVENGEIKSNGDLSSDSYVRSDIGSFEEVFNFSNENSGENTNKLLYSIYASSE